MGFWNDRQIRKYWYFLIGSLIVLFLFARVYLSWQTRAAQRLLAEHDNAVVTSLLEKGISGTSAAEIISNTETSEEAALFLDQIGRADWETARWEPSLLQLHRGGSAVLALLWLLWSTGFVAGAFLFFRKREALYQRAVSVLADFTEGSCGGHMPQNEEGTIFRLFASVDQLATMLQAQKEAEHGGREFLKDTISDISHQLKTPLAALSMYQEIIAEESDCAETVNVFSGKMKCALCRMESLITSMLKMARLDVGNIVFEKKLYQVSELFYHAVSELTVRAQKEGKKLVLEGPANGFVACDLEWTGEAIGNIVKNALDHTQSGGIIRIRYEGSPYMGRLCITDNGHGIAKEDLPHIFKRFYRSRVGTDTQGAGLGLSLAKSIIEGQGGVLTVESAPEQGTTFTVSLLTKL